MGTVRLIGRLVADVLIGTTVIGGISAAAIVAVVFVLLALGQRTLLDTVQKDAIAGITDIEPGMLVSIFTEAWSEPDPQRIALSHFDYNSLPYKAFHDTSPQIDLTYLHYWAHDVRWFFPVEAVAALADTICYIAARSSWFGTAFAVAALIIGWLVAELVLTILTILARVRYTSFDIPGIAHVPLAVVGAVFFGSITAAFIYKLMSLGAPPGPQPSLAALCFGSSGVAVALPLASHLQHAVAEIARELRNVKAA